MEITQLRYFQVVAEYQHITRAAEHLNISQPALSAMISRLENELDVQLFDHKGRSIVLNENGQFFLKRVNHILLELDDCKHELREMAEQYEKTISIAVTSPQFLQDMYVFMAKHPDYKWNQKMAEVSEIKKMLNTGQSIIAVTSPGIYGEEYESILLLRDNFKLALHRDHPLARLDTIRLSDIADERFILLHQGVPFRNQTDAVFTEMDFHPRYVIECDRLLRRELVNANAGITLASRSSEFRHLFSDEVVFREIDGLTQSREIVYSYRKGRHLTRAYREFLDFLFDKFQDPSAQRINKADTMVNNI
ncbi:MAG: LysR family transcriptional regulator [Lachnospiraceae bacterium]|nr:LysR family transcriptional regulator [Lachnospiraceae bacterium]